MTDAYLDSAIAKIKRCKPLGDGWLTAVHFTPQEIGALIDLFSAMPVVAAALDEARSIADGMRMKLAKIAERDKDVQARIDNLSAQVESIIKQRKAQ